MHTLIFSLSVHIPLTERGKCGLQTLLMPPCLALLWLKLKSIHPFVSASHSASLSFLCSSQNTMLTSLGFFSTLICCASLCFFINLHYITVALILWAWINTIYHSRLMFAPLIQTGKSASDWKMAFLMGERSVCVYACVCWEMVVVVMSCGGGYPIDLLVSPSSDLWHKNNHKGSRTWIYTHNSVKQIKVCTL